MVEKFATDVSNKLNATLSRDFDGIVGLPAHLRKLITLLCFESDQAKMIGIWGPGGIDDYISSMLADSNLDVKNGMKTLAAKSLVELGRTPYKLCRDVSYRHVMMHSLLKQLGRQVVHEHADEPGKRQYLVEPEEICDVLTKETGTGSVIGISFDMTMM
ncbi:hypothetical protein F2Q69_00043651, partial [Brassica cretica]